MAKYIAQVGGSSWSKGPQAEFGSLKECRQFAESYGTTADWCSVYRHGHDNDEPPVATYHRNRTGDGTRWYKSAP